MRCSACVVVLFVATLCPPSVLARNWTDSAGKYSVEARFLDCRSGKVRLQKKDGTYLFTPQIRVVPYGTTGSIVGDVEPSGINAAVYLMQRSDTLGTVFPDPESMSASTNFDISWLDNVPAGFMG